MKINEKKVIELGADKNGIETFRQYPGLVNGYADVGALCWWAAYERGPDYVFWLLPKLLGPVKAIKWAILAAKRRCNDSTWNAWADKWLSGEDRTEKSAETAAWTAEAVETMEPAARSAAWAATWMKYATMAAAKSAYIAAEDEAAEIKCQIADALEILENERK